MYNKRAVYTFLQNKYFGGSAVFFFIEQVFEKNAFCFSEFFCVQRKLVEISVIEGLKFWVFILKLFRMKLKHGILYKNFIQNEISTKNQKMST